MAWSTPKTDWSSTDFINASDYNRIANNLYYIRDFARKMYDEINILEMETGKSFSDLPFVSIYNVVEQNLATLNAGTYRLPIGNTKTFQVNRPYIDYVELNRIESVCLRLKTYLDSQYEARRRLAFTLGSQKGIKV